MSVNRSFNRTASQPRPISFNRGYLSHALGSCLVTCGETRVLCSASIEERVPSWLRSTNTGWLTAEYAMLPGSTSRRTARETTPKGRSQEIARLIGRSLRAVTNLKAMGECTLTVDCDVLTADGGTRTAAITGAWIAAHDAFMRWVEAGRICRIPLTSQVAAISVGMVDGVCLCDLDYQEDSHAEIDMNVVMTSGLELIEVQGTGERTPFSREKMNTLLDLAQGGIQEIVKRQGACVDWEE